MEAKFSKILNRISAGIQAGTFGLLVFAILLILNQQHEILHLKSGMNSLEDQINSTNNQPNNVENKLDDIERKIDMMEMNLSVEIENVRRSVIIWSN